MTRRFVRVAISVAATLGVLAAGAWMDGVPHVARANAGPRPPALIADSYPRRSEPGEIRIGDALALNGQRMQLSAFTTADPPERVVEFYAETFRRRGLVPVAAAQARLGHVSVFDPVDGLQRFVTAIPERSRRTLVLMGATDPSGFALLRSTSAASYPVPEQHRAFIAYESEDAQVRAQSGQFVSVLSAAEVAKFYRDRLIARGFVERPESGAGLLAFVNATEQISVAVQSLEQERGAAVFVTRIEGER
jgi:hypothetical protein